MMGCRTTIFQLCKRLSLCNETVLSRRVAPLTTQHDLLMKYVNGNNFNGKFIRCKSTRIVSDEFDDNEDNDKFFDALDEDGDFVIDPKTRRVRSRFDMDKGNSQKSFRFDRSKIRNSPRRSFRDDFENDRDRPTFDSEDGLDFESNTRQFGNRFSDRSRSMRSFSDNYSDRRRGGMEDLWNELNEKKVDFNDQTEFTKDVYEEHPDISTRPEEEDHKFLNENQITVSGKNKKRPILSFNETCFTDEISSALNKMKFHQPTPIQSIGWPHALSGQDIVGIAQTGSGKTLSFILPAILHIRAQRKIVPNEGPIALVVCPTRELALQCQDVVNKFRRICKINSVAVYGGQSKVVQEDQLMQPKLDMIIACPGRLLDFLTVGVISLRHCSFVVLDEADRMLDMGFEPQIRSMMGQIRPDRQVLMWSATWPEEIRDLASDFLKDYVHVKIGSQQHAVNSDIEHEFHYCTPYEKMDLLFDHLEANIDPQNSRHCAKTLIFCSTKSQCSRLQGILRKQGLYVDSLHGDKSQLQRDTVMRNFRSGRISVLIASDVAARGLDVSDIQYVVNYDLPNNIDSYIHRVGRTGRAGKTGKAISFITAEDLDMAKPLIKVLEDVGHSVPDLLHNLIQRKMKMKSYRSQARQPPTGFRGRPKFRY